MRYTVWIVAIIFIVIGIGLAVGAMWRQPYTDAINATITEPLPLPEKTYFHVVWLNKQELVLDYGEPGVVGRGNSQITLYHLETQGQTPLSLEIDEGCDTPLLNLVTALPDGTIGVLLRCYKEMVPERSLQFSLIPETGEGKLLYRYPESFPAATYTYAPDMKQFLQTVRGGMRDNAIYLVDEQGEMRQLFETYEHAYTPAWSPDGSRIAFFGTADDPEEGLTDSRLRGIPTVKAARELVLADRHGQILRTVLDGVQFPDSLTWLPDQEKLLFAGDYRNTPGIWLFDLEADHLTRIWDANDRFALSPDGRAIVVINIENFPDQLDITRLLLLHPPILSDES